MVEVGRAVRLRLRHESRVRRCAGRSGSELRRKLGERREGVQANHGAHQARLDPRLARRLVQTLGRHVREVHAEPRAARERAEQQVVLRRQQKDERERGQRGAACDPAQLRPQPVHRDQQESERRPREGRLVGGADPGEPGHRGRVGEDSAGVPARGASEPDRRPGHQHGGRQGVEEPALVDEPGGGEDLQQGRRERGAPRRPELQQQRVDSEDPEVSEREEHGLEQARCQGRGDRLEAETQEQVVERRLAVEVEERAREVVPQQREVEHVPVAEDVAVEAQPEGCPGDEPREKEGEEKQQLGSVPAQACQLRRSRAASPRGCHAVL